MKPVAGRPVLAVAGLSVRLLAEAAARDGLAVRALDLFGDQDTRAASVDWRCIGDASRLRIDDAALVAGLHEAAARGALAWVAGAGLEGRADLLAAGARILPLWGTPPDAVAAVRDPRRFFDQLQVWGQSFPPVRFERPETPAGWWLKDGRACGGWHIRAARADDVASAEPGRYWQRHADGRPLSATLLAAGGRAVLLGVNEQIVRPRRGHPMVFHGVIGPVAVPGGLPTRVQGLADRLAATYGLQGLVGLDFLVHGDEWTVLELNPRPPASLALYGASGGLMAAHRAACESGRLPQGTELAALRGDGALRGLAYVFARRALDLNDGRWQRLSAWPGAHDRPAAPLQLAAGDPVCTVQIERRTASNCPTDAWLSAHDAATTAAMRAALDAATEQLLDDLETAT